MANKNHAYYERSFNKALNIKIKVLKRANLGCKTYFKVQLHFRFDTL